MLHFLAKAWRSVAALVVWVGLLCLPIVFDLIAPAPDGAPSALDREALLIVFSGLLVLWLLWADARPALRQWRRDGRVPAFSIRRDIYTEARGVVIPPEIKDSVPIPLYLNTYYLVVTNNLSTGETLKNVRARLSFEGRPATCRIKNLKRDAVILKAGESAYFEIGRIATRTLSAAYEGPVTRPAEWIQSCVFNLPRDIRRYEFASARRDPDFGLSSDPLHHEKWTVLLTLSADDRKPETVEIIIDLKNEANPITFRRANPVNPNLANV